LLMKKGAEADLFLEEWHGMKVIVKKRVRKAYRIPQLDDEIRTYRTIHEAQIIHRAKEAGVPTPLIFMVDTAEKTIVMEFVEGRQIKRCLKEMQREKRLGLCRYIGKLIGKLHREDIVHGDLTTSNMILTSEGVVFLVDFGLSEISEELEARGVDLHLMKRTFQSTHYEYADECFEAVMEGYKEIVGEEIYKKILTKIAEIERRGRYVSER